jgi:adenylate cyclase class 2
MISGAVSLSLVREVEVKYRVADPAQVLAVLADRGVTFGPPVCQDDQAYAPHGWAYGQSKIGVAFARLRTQDGRHTFTVKTPVTSEQDCDEYESPITDREQLHHAIIAMGYQPTIRIVKHRRIAHYGETTLCLDDVDGLGTFLELEQMVTHDHAATARAEMTAFITGLAVSVEPVDQTYDSLLRQHPTG